MNDINHFLGKYVKVKKDHEEFELEQGMIAFVSGIKENKEHDGLFYELFFDFTDFERYNERHMKPNYYGENHVANKTWKQTSFYPANKKLSYYFNSEEEASEVLEILEINSVEVVQQPQSQESLSAQLLQLKFFANKLGLYDAADYCEEGIVYLLGGKN